MQISSEQTKRTLAEDLKARAKRFLKDFGVIRRAFVHPDVPWYGKLVAGCSILYVVSPIQLLPNFIPIIGQMDDVLVVTLGIRFLRRCVPPDVLEDCENESSGRAVSATPAKPETRSVLNSECWALPKNSVCKK
jgi:uncharacterized membrane protein YkvA (DUF1232 family)